MVTAVPENADTGPRANGTPFDHLVENDGLPSGALRWDFATVHIRFFFLLTGSDSDARQTNTIGDKQHSFENFSLNKSPITFEYVWGQGTSWAFC